MDRQASAKKKGEVGGGYKLDTSNPRIRAAMRILGINREDLQSPSEKPPPLGFGSAHADPASSPMAKKRLELLEQKRQDLVTEVMNHAESLPEEEVEQILAPPQDNETALQLARSASASMLEKEMAKLEALKTKTKGDLQRVVSDGLLRNQKAEEGVQKNEVSKQRLAALRNQRRLAVEAQRKEQAKKEAAMRETLKKLERGVEEEGETTMARLDAKWVAIAQERDAADKVRWEKKEAWRTQLGERREQAAQEARIKQAAKDKLYREEYEKNEIVMARVAEHVEELRGTAEAAKAKFDQTRANVMAHDEKRAAEREASFRASTDNFDRAREDGAKHRAATSAAARDGALKRRKAVDKNFADLSAQRKARDQAIVTKFEVNMAGQNRENHMAEESGKRRDQREMMRELYTLNKGRMERSDGHHHSHGLKHISANVDKVNGVIAQRQEIQQMRAETLKSSLIEKDRAREMFMTLKSASPDMVNGLLKSMDLPPVEIPTKGEEKKEEK